MTRAVRDILAECMRRERLGGVLPLWQDWQTFADEDCEQVRLRADHLIRLLATFGVELVQTGEPRATTRPDSDIIMRCALVGDLATERVIRREADDLWTLATVKAGQSTDEQSFSLTVAMINAGQVLTDDPAAKSIPGLGRRLAAVAEIYRLCAQATGGRS